MLLDDDTYDRQISTHALLAEGDSAETAGIVWLEISTHALLAEGDSAIL